MVKFVEHRVADPRILRLIQKWLKAGVMEEGKWSDTQTESPQGSVILPLLANIYLHYAFDLWVDAWRKKWAQGDLVVVRYADDIILGFQHQTEADCFLEIFRERLEKFGLELHPDKTRRIEFGRFAEQNRERRGKGKPETFDFLGFTHIQREKWIRAIHGAAHHDPQAHASQAARGEAATPRAHARSRAPNRTMAQVGRARLLQLLRGTGQPRESGGVSGSGAGALVAKYSSPEPETPDPMDAHPRFGSAMASATARAPSLS
jgi:Reverse transcriptase (RNA-dependent DNA polymerase)